MEKTAKTYLNTFIGYFVLVALVSSTVVPLPVTAEDGATAETESTETEVIVAVEEAQAEEVVEEDTAEESSAAASSETTSSESTSSSEESSSSYEASSSDSSESEQSSSLSSETTYGESEEETEISATTEETSLGITTTAPQTNASTSKTGSAATNASSSNTVTASTTAGATSNATSTSAPSTTAAQTSLATTTDTTASSTPTASVATITDGNTTVGTTTTTVTPAETSSSTATSSPTHTASSTIATGAAIATANILNVVNTNLTNADGSIIFVDATGDINETLDVRSSLGGGGSSGTCTLSSCRAHVTNIDLESDATIDNALVVDADTGNNLIENTGSGSILTGNAYANANIVNVANANIVDSQYLLFTLNAFGDFNGDLVLPGLLPFIKKTAATTPSISNKDTAIIINEIVTSAVTGENTAAASSSTITTGDATTGLSLYNNINTTLANDNVSVLFRVHGDWNGVVFGLPETVAWYETEQGYLLDINGNKSVASAGVGAIAATSTAVINNRINVRANTGGNQVLGADEALISTGNAYAGVNVVNVANANIVGQNWMLAIVNVFGDFNGNVSFGRPDVWVGGAANVPKNPRYGSEVTYTYTIQNNGDAPASDIVVTDEVSPFVAPTEIGEAGEHATTTKQITWRVQALAPGESTTVSYKASITTNDYNQAVTNTISANLTEDDDNYDNNTEVLTFFTRKSSNGGYNVGFGGQIDDRDEADAVESTEDSTGTDYGPIQSLQMTRQPFLSTVTNQRPNSVQTITIYNDTNKVIPGVIFTDQLYDIKDRLVREEHWELGDVLPNEQITLEYTLNFNHAATPPLQTYSFDSVFQNQESYNVIKLNGHINHLAEVGEVITQSTDENVSYEGVYDVTTNPGDLARVLGTTTSSSTVATDQDEVPLIPVISSTGGKSDGSNTINTYYLLLSILFILLLAVYAFLERRKLAPVFVKVQHSMSLFLSLLVTFLK